MKAGIVQNLNIFSIRQNFGKNLFRNSKDGRQFRIASTNPNGDFFQKAIPMTPILEYIENKTDKFKISDYYSLTPKNIRELRNAVTKDIDDFAKGNVYISKNLKKHLDEQYGENNYVFISIGRSPSMIGKTLECMGVETKYLPISDLGDKDLDFNKYLQENTFEKYGEFLRSQGLTKKEWKRVTKHLSFMIIRYQGEAWIIFIE